MRRPHALLALLLLATAARSQSEDVSTLVETGRAHCLAHEWPQALVALDAALAREPDHLEALRWRGHARTGAGQYPLALQDLDRAIELGADDAWTCYARAMALHHLGRLDDAILGYTRALAIDPTWVKAHEWRGFSLSLLGRHVQALPDLDLALQQDPGNPWLSFIRGKVHAALGDLAAAEQDFWKCVDADAQNADAAAQLGYVKAVLGETKAAVAWLQKALKLAPVPQCEARLWLYQLHVDAGDPTAAQAELAALQQLATEPTAAWPCTVASFLQGKLPAAQLLAAASDPAVAEPERRARRCAALLHVALAQDPTRGIDAKLAAFARCLATEARDQWEWALAMQRIRRLSDER